MAVQSHPRREVIREDPAVCRAKAVPSVIGYLKNLSIGPEPGIEPATSRSAIKRSAPIELISPAAVKPFFSISHHLSSFQVTDPALQQSVPDDTPTLFSGMSVHAVRLFSYFLFFCMGKINP